MRATSKCRTCEAPIRWGRNATTGKIMPLDPQPDADGNIWITHFEDGTPIFHVARTPDDVPSSEPLRYRSHFATCPDAAEFRR